MSNLLLDPGFETGNWFNNWPGYTTSGTHTDSQATDFVHGGSFSFKIIGNTACDAGRNQTFTLFAGNYVLSGWIRTSGATNACFVLRENGGFTAIAGTHISADQDWTYFTQSFTTTIDQGCTLLIGLGSYGSASTGTAWFDDLSLDTTRLTSNRFPNLGPNIKVDDGHSRNEIAN